MDCFPQEFDLFGADDVEMIDWSDPISDHPLNDGLVMWLLAGQGIPGGFGGDTWLDLTRKHSGTLTNMDPATDWVGSGPTGGFGHLVFTDATTNRASMDSDPVDVVTIELVIRRNTTASNGPYVFSGTDAFAANTWHWGIYHFGSNTNFAVQGNNNTTTTTIGTEWEHLICVRDDGTGSSQIYRDGKSVASGTGGSGKVGSNPETLWVGYAGSSSNSTGFDIAHIATYSEPLSASVALGRYTAISQGYPGLLNRVPLRRMSPVVAAGGLAFPPIATRKRRFKPLLRM